uniref:Centrosomal protein of 162 kDa n=1 Tax=Clastoptera arizonana TaxID=38151 RepID=A0A1B6DRU2_9HEMI
MYSTFQQKYEEHVGDIEERLKAAQLENHSLKTNKIENSHGPLRKKPAPKEDAHLLATIRGLKQELTGKDKEILKLHKELDDAKKTNKRLQKEREKQLNPNMPPKTARGGNLIKDIDKASSESVGSLSSAKNYNPLLYNEFQETMVLLRSENQMLQNEVKKLEEDLITMHGKRVHDVGSICCINLAQKIV